MIVQDMVALAILAGAACVAALGTWIATWAIGPALMRRSRRLAFLACALIVPALTVIVGIVLFRIDAGRYPRSDGPPMALTGTLMIALLMLAVTIPVARLGLRRGRP